MLRRLLILGFVILGSGCEDQLFEVCGQVTRCSDGAPLVGTRVRLSLLSGVSGPEGSTTYTAPDGHYCATLNEPPDASARLALDKPGYAPLEETFSGAPDQERDYCLAEAE